MILQRVIVFILFFVWCVQGKTAPKTNTDVYVIIYATYKGKTGHAGIAVDKYKIVYHDVKTATGIVYKEDTVKTGELLYYDFWPNDDYFNKVRTTKDIPGIYYKLPEKLFDEITVNSLVSQGIPHKEGYPCDGLLKLKTSVDVDFALTHVLDSITAKDKKFNARHFNCSDFVLLALRPLLHKKISAKEFTPFTFSTTPNKLYKRLRKLPGVAVLKNADAKARGSFIGQRVLYKLFQ